MTSDEIVANIGRRGVRLGVASKTKLVRESFTAIGEQTSPTDMLEVVFEVVQLGSDSEKYGILSPSQAKCQRTI